MRSALGDLTSARPQALTTGITLRTRRWNPVRKNYAVSGMSLVAPLRHGTDTTGPARPSPQFRMGRRAPVGEPLLDGVRGSIPARTTNSQQDASKKQQRGSTTDQANRVSARVGQASVGGAVGGV